MLLLRTEVAITISSIAAATTVYGNDATTVFNFSFVVPNANSLSVLYVDEDGNQNLLTSAQYNVVLNAPVLNSLWRQGGTVEYPTAGTPIATGTSLIITRTVNLTQGISIQNQGNFYPVVTEEALDLLCMEIQQVSARTGQIRGTWATGVAYNFGDVVQDGANGANTQNYYMCAIANTSGVWTTDLTAGDWSLAIDLQAIAGSGTVEVGTAGQMAYYASSTNAVQGNANANMSAGALTLGQSASTQGSLKLAGSAGSVTTLAAPTTGGGTMTLQAGTDSLVGKATTDIFTNKTFNTAGTGNVFQINGTGITGVTGGGAVVLATTPTINSPTLVTPALGAATATSINGLIITTTTGTLTLVNGSSLVTAGANSITLTSTGPTNVTLPTTGTLATLAGSENLTNKTITSAALSGTFTGPATFSGALTFTADPTFQSIVGSIVLAQTFRAGTTGSTLGFTKSRNASLNGNTIVVSGDTLGSVVFYGANGTGYNAGAQIISTVDGTPGASNDMPGSLDFYTTPDGSGSPARNMRIRQDGTIEMANLAGTGSRAVLTSAGGVLSAPVSDITVKQNVVPSTYGINEIELLDPVFFEYIDEFKDYGAARQVGLIAQDVGVVIPEAVGTTTKTGKKYIDYPTLIPVLIRAVQQQQEMIDALMKRGS